MKETTTTTKRTQLIGINFHFFWNESKGSTPSTGGFQMFFNHHVDSFKFFLNSLDSWWFSNCRASSLKVVVKYQWQWWISTTTTLYTSAQVETRIHENK